MSLRHEDDLPPMTPSQQAEAIHLAARLQAEHEENSTERLFQAAEEAGIERRFLDEAAWRVAEGSLPLRPSSAVPRPFIAVLTLTLLNMLALRGQSAESVGIVLENWQIALLVGTPLIASLWVGREPRVRWTVPAAVLAVWLALALPDALYHLLLEGRTLKWLPALVLIIGGLQFVAALIGAFVHWHRPTRHSSPVTLHSR